MKLIGKVALVTGGGTGIGRAVAAALAGEGAQVVITGRRADKLQEACAEIDQPALVSHALMDVADRQQVTTTVAKMIERFGAIDILVNNAGVNVTRRSVAQLAPEDWDSLLAVNATGAFNVIHAVLPQMRARKDGVIISISSLAGVRASSLGGLAYSASKHALNALTRVVALEEGENGIRATNICPGEVNTPLLDSRPIKVSDEQRAQILLPEDVAAAVLFVATLPPRAHVPEMLIKPTIHIFA